MLRDASKLASLNVLSSFCGRVVALQEMYRKDCNLAAQLLQCNKSLYRTQLSEVRPPVSRLARLTCILYSYSTCTEEQQMSFGKCYDVRD